MTQIKELRKIIKGLKPNTKVSFGNYTAYTPRTFKGTLNIFHKDLSIIKPELTEEDPKEISEIIFWVEE